MPLPLLPIAGAALAGLALVRAVRGGLALADPARIDQRCEDALDELGEGVALARSAGRDQTNVTARLSRVVRLTPGGPGIAIDAAVVTRFRLRRV